MRYYGRVIICDKYLNGSVSENTLCMICGLWVVCIPINYNRLCDIPIGLIIMCMTYLAACYRGGFALGQSHLVSPSGEILDWHPRT